MPLSEFDRRCRGYLRREAARDKPLRLIATILLNVNRGERDPVLAPEEVMHLYGDPPPKPPMSEEIFDDTMARLAEFDTL